MMTPTQRTISFTIYQKATGKKNPLRGKHGGMYPSATQKFNEESLIAEMLPFRPKEPITEPVMLTISVKFEIPKSKPKWWKEAVFDDRIMHDKKPDCDNIIKQIGDCLQKLQFIKNDSQIFSIYCVKFWNEYNEIQITITPSHNPNRQEYNEEVIFLSKHFGSEE